MAPIGSLPVSLRIAAGVGVIESVALATYALAIVGFEQRAQTSGISGTQLAPAVLVGLYLVFAALAAGVAWLLIGLRAAAMTPYLLLQAFALVVAQPLVLAPATRALGAVVAAVALGGAFAVLMPSSRSLLRR